MTRKIFLTFSGLLFYAEFLYTETDYAIGALNVRPVETLMINSTSLL